MVFVSVKGCLGMYEALWTVVEQEADGSRSSIASSSLCHEKMFRLVFEINMFPAILLILKGSWEGLA